MRIKSEEVWFRKHRHLEIYEYLFFMWSTYKVEIVSHYQFDITSQSFSQENKVFCLIGLKMCVLNKRQWDNTGWPRKNGTAYFPQYVDAITGISVWEATSPEKNDTKISNFGSISSLFSRAHFVRQCWGPKFFLFSETRAKEMPFRLAIVVSSKPINLINAHPYTRNPLVNNAYWQS